MPAFVGDISGIAKMYVGTSEISIAYSATVQVWDNGGYVPPPADETPNNFSFASATDAALDTLITSAAIIPSGYDTPVGVSIVGGEYRIGTGAWTAASGMISPGQAIQVRRNSSAAYNTSVSVTLTVGGIVGTFQITTLTQVGDPDTTPNSFVFTDQSDVGLSLVLASNSVTPTGFDTATPITITGGDYRINNGAWTNAAGTFNPGDSVMVRHTSSASYGTSVSTILTIGGVSDTFTTTTAVEPALTAPVLTKTSAAGTNPMSWSGSYTNVVIGRDSIELNWRVDGGAWQSELHAVTSDDQITGSWIWTNFAAATFPASSVVEVRERQVRDPGVSQTISAWSNTINDTMAGAAWSPASLFASGEYGFILDPADNSKNFTDAGVTLAATDAQVGQINDLSPNGFNFTATGTGRPTRRNVGGRWYYEFDGIDDLIKSEHAGLYNAGAMTFIFAVETPNTADLGVVFNEQSATVSNPFYRPFTEVSAAGNRRLWIRNDAGTTIKNSPSTTVSPFDGAWNMAMLEDTGAAVIVERTTAAGAVGNTGAGTTYTRSGTLTMNRSSFGGTSSTTDGNFINCLVGRVFAIGRLLTAEEKTQVKQWIAATSGITV